MRTRRLLAQFNAADYADTERKQALLREMFGRMGKTELMQELTDKIEAYLTDKFENSPDAYNVREDSASVK